MKKTPQPSTKHSDSPDATIIKRLFKELTGPSKDASERALRALVTLGSPIREVLATRNVVVRDDVYCTDEIVALIDEIGPSHPRVYAGLAKAVNGPGWRERRVAIFICTQIQSPPIVVLKAIVSALTSDWRDDIRSYAALSLSKIRSSAPVVLRGLAIALQEYDPSVLHEVMRAIRHIGATSPELLAGLGQFLYEPNSAFCEMALSCIDTLKHEPDNMPVDLDPLLGSSPVAAPTPMLQSGNNLTRELGAASTRQHASLTLSRALRPFEPALIAALRQLANSSFSFSYKRYPGVEDDADYWHEQRVSAEVQHKRNRDIAAEMLGTIPAALMVPHVTAISTPQHPIRGEDDERVMALFRDVNLGEYLTHLQVFWCVGWIDRAAMESAGRAMGWAKLSAVLHATEPSFKYQELPSSIDYLMNACVPSIDGLMDREPFYSHAWSSEIVMLPLRSELKQKNRRGSQWTSKAWKAWKYIDRFLAMKGLLPQSVDDFG